MGRTRDRRPRLECLEGRRLLSASADAGAAAARAQFHADGSGLAAAVIDTGVNYRHEALGGGFGPGHKVLDGADFADGHATPDATTWQHGTAVAGLIASADPAHPGVAPGADIVALRVFGDDNRGSYARVADALQWIVDHHAQDHISVVNISISDGGNYAVDPFAHDGTVGQRIDALIGELAAAGIPVVAAAGNDFAGAPGMGYPAVVVGVIRVTAVDGAGRLATGAQRLGSTGGNGPSTTLAAPGAHLVAPLQGNTFAKVDGTSFAAAEVSGAILILQQVYQSRFHALPSVADLTAWLKGGSDPISGDGLGGAFGRLNVAKSAALIPAASPRRPEPQTAANAPGLPTVATARPMPRGPLAARRAMAAKARHG